MLNALPPKYPQFIIEQTAIAGALTPEVLSKSELAEQSAQYIAARLNRMADEVERGWAGAPTEDGGLFSPANCVACVRLFRLTGRSSLQLTRSA